ncbi:MAG: hypothetical protein E2600_13160 [Chryseobacterium sp.]|nr:hypothetical protein [Chryseobacterium sp.]
MKNYFHMTKRLLLILVVSLVFGLQLKAQNKTIVPSDVIPFQVAVEKSNFKGKNALALEIQGQANACR